MTDSRALPWATSSGTAKQTVQANKSTRSAASVVLTVVVLWRWLPRCRDSVPVYRRRWTRRTVADTRSPWAVRLGFRDCVSTE